MLPRWHILFGFIFSLALLLLFQQIDLYAASIIFLASFLIDADHYLHYVFRKRDLNLRRAYWWFRSWEGRYEPLPKSERNKIYFPVCIFHGIEAFALLIILSFYSTFILWILIGFALHRFLDDVFSIYYGFPYHDFSATYGFVRAKKLIHIEDYIRNKKS